MASDLFSAGEALRFGWQTTRANLKPLLILAAIGGVLAILQGEGSAVVSLLAQIGQVAVGLALIRAALLLHDGKAVDLSNQRELLRGFWPYLLTSVLLALVVGVGLVLLIVPGVVLLLTYGYAGFLVVDRDLDPIAAMKESARLTRGRRWELLGFGLLLLLTNLLGALALGIGLLVTIPTTTLAAVHVLRRLQAHAGESVVLRERTV